MRTINITRLWKGAVGTMRRMGLDVLIEATSDPDPYYGSEYTRNIVRVRVMRVSDVDRMLDGLY